MQSDDTDSDTERAKEAEEMKKEAEKKEKEKQTGGKGKESDNKPSSGTSTMGANTPSGRPEKHKLKSSSKRPGSPNLSEASGNESSRKKVKMQHGVRLALSPKVTPSASRAASPAAATATTDTAFPTKEEVLAKIPDGGISIKGLINLFKSKSYNKEQQSGFIKLVKEVAITNKETGLLVKRKQA
jgi:transcription initiation factor TFIIF subunit alpha